jgi:uncharacterized membrane protein YgdD (TMEM256/DUF423 family)
MHDRSKTILFIAFLSGALAVILGAFGAHLWKSHLLEKGSIDTYKTAVLYHFIHSVMMVLDGILYHVKPSRMKWLSAILFFSGILLFSGSLYGLSLTGISMLGTITPFGGLCLIAAWLLLARDAIKKE